MSTFTDLVKKLNDMETSEDKSFENEATPNSHIDPNVSAMKDLLESVDSVGEKKDQLKGRDAFKKKSKPGGSETPHPARGKLVGEDNVQEDLLGQLKKEFTDLLVTKEADKDVEEDIQDDRKYQSLEELRDKLEDIAAHVKRLGIMDGATEIQGKPVTGTGDIHDQLTSMYKAVDSLQGAVGRALKIVPGEQNPDIQKFKAGMAKKEAVGEFADPIYDLMDQIGADTNHPILDELIRYLDGDTIKDFVADYRRNHEVPNNDRDVSDAPFKAE